MTSWSFKKRKIDPQGRSHTLSQRALFLVCFLTALPTLHCLCTYLPCYLDCLADCRCLTLQNSGFPDSNRCAPTRSNQLSREAGRNLLKSESWNRYGKSNFDSDNFDFENHAQIQNQPIYIYLPSLSLFPMSFLGFPITYNVTGTGCNQALILGR